MRPVAAAPLVLTLVLSLASPPVAWAAPLFGLPVPEGTCHDGCRFDGLGCYKPDLYHTGHDYVPNGAATDILATADGTVAALFVNSEGHGMGNAVVLRHGLAGGGTVYSLYGHLAGWVPGLQVGDEVVQGEKIATMGGSGFGQPTFWGLHVHVEIKDAPVEGDPVSGQYEGYTPTPAENWGYHNDTDFIGKVEFVPLHSEVISRPQAPSGPVSLDVGEQGSFASGGAASSEGHPVQYRFDWGDGENSGWQAGASASHAWASAGRFSVSATARCAQDTNVLSDPATTTVSVAVSAPVFQNLPGALSVDEGLRLEVPVRASDPHGATVAISPEGDWPANSRLEGGSGGTAKIVFWPDYNQSGTYHLGLRAASGGGVSEAEVAVTVRDIAQVHLFGATVTGAGGGAISGGDGSVVIDIPAGALGPGQTATGGTADPSMFSSLPAKHFGPVVDLGPPGSDFGAPLRISLHYQEEVAPGAPVTIYVNDPATGGWRAASGISGVALDSGAKTLSFHTTQAGLFVAADAPGPSGGGGGCFIATAAWGSADAAEVLELRRARDVLLLPTLAGRWLVAHYYRFSPPAASFLGTSPRLRALVRLMLRPLALAGEVWLDYGPLLGWLLLIVVGRLAWGTAYPPSSRRT